MNTMAPMEGDPARWKQRAEQARRAADQAVDPVDKQLLLDIAQAYEQLAALAEAKLGTRE